ncbi:MAG: TonB-dependent receptor [Verrucomicrobia bacterium]|nr:TonB-dependent receptor [Verrucomicrobiota bacterium]
MNTKTIPLLAVLVALLAADSVRPVAASAPVAPPVQLPAFPVEAEAEKDHYVQGPFLPDVQGPKINVGKKTTILDLDSLPRITGNNYRQALALAPGLVLSEETSPLVSIGYRGLEPHRAQFTQVLKDGIPIHADQFGYPEAYYTPPLDTVDRLEFVRGGAALMYGPQPGGALNYVTHRPRPDRPLSGATLHTLGTDDYYSTFSHLDGTVGRVGYYGYHNRRRSAGLRTANSDYTLEAFLGRLVFDAASVSRWILTFETYDESHGEPGGLTFATGPGTVNYLADRRAPSRLFDRFDLDRRAVSLVWERDFSRGMIVTRAWGIDYVRASRRQGGGGFGTLSTGAAAGTNTIERQQFTTWGVETRGRLDWGPDQRYVFTAGAQYHRTASPRTDARGATPDATAGLAQVRSQRDITGAPVFVENLFRLGALSVTPGFRLESVRQDVRELLNVARTAAGRPLAARDDGQKIPLLGLALAYDVSRATQAYANLSQSYRPMIFTQAVPNAATTVVNADLAEGRAVQFEFGVRAQPRDGLVLDASVFHLEFKNQIGTLALPGGLSTVANVGRAVHRGVEAAAHYDLLRAFDRPASSGALNLHANVLFLDAGFRAGPAAGRTPQYAPRHLVRSGLTYTRGSQFKLGLTGTLSADSFADDANTPTRHIPAYAVWDLTAEWRVPGTPVRLISGVNNLLDEDYYSRIRPDGIDPAPRRNVYLGAALEF